MEQLNAFLFPAYRRLSLRLVLSLLVVVLMCPNAFAQEHNSAMDKPNVFSLSGTVKDNKGAPLMGASVVIAGTTNGVTTDIDGGFALKVQPGNVLNISFIGFVSRNVIVTKASKIDIVLEEDATTLDEVVVTALGIKRSEKALSYNVQVIDADKMNVVKDANFMNGLSGKIAGITINASSSGVGGATRVVMRGTKSLYSGNSALYVIDGVPIFNDNRGQTDGALSLQPRGEGISDINPDDIESMSVLSGPAAAALYGSAAAQGVIIINTKRGSQGKVRVTLSNTTTFSNPFLMHEFQSSYSNRTGEFKSWGDKGSSYNYDPKKFFQTGVNMQNSVSVSMGNDKNQTYVSAAMVDAKGMLPDNKYGRYNFTIRNTTKFFNDKMTFDAGFSYIQQNDANMMAQGEYYNPLVAAYLYPRGENFDDVRLFEEYSVGRAIYIQRWKWGTQGLNMQNPYWTAKRNIYGTDKKRYMANASLKYDIVDWLNISGRVRIDNSNSDYHRKNYASTAELFSGENGFYSIAKTDDSQLYADVIATVNKRICDFSINVNAGASLTHLTSDMLGSQGPLKDMPNVFNVFNIDDNGRDAFNKQGGWEEQTQSVFASGEVGWRSMLYLTATARVDWASALAKTEQLYFFYPSVGLSAVITEMVKMPEAISYLKLRASFAQVGSSIPRGLSQPGYVYKSTQGVWASNTFKPLTKIHPEMTDSWEAGLNAKFFDGKLNLDVTYYKSDTRNQFLEVPISSASGYSSMFVQAGSVQNEGVELSVGYNQSWKDFRWSSNFVYSFNRNRVNELTANAYDDVTDQTYSIDQMTKGNVIVKAGGTMGDLYVTRKLKRDLNGQVWVNPKTGNVEIEQLKTPEYVGCVLPKGNLGFRNDFGWKNLRVGFMFAARLGGVVMSQTQALLDEYGVSRQTEIARNNGGIPLNYGVMDTERYYSVVGGKNGDMSQYVYDATNVRLQEASIGYTLPNKWFKGVCKIDLSVVGRNLWMIYCKAPIDPELTPSTGTFGQGVDYFMQPSQRNIGFSVNVQF